MSFLNLIYPIYLSFHSPFLCKLFKKWRWKMCEYLWENNFKSRWRWNGKASILYIPIQGNHSSSLKNFMLFSLNEHLSCTVFILLSNCLVWIYHNRFKQFLFFFFLLFYFFYFCYDKQYFSEKSLFPLSSWGKGYTVLIELTGSGVVQLTLFTILPI